MVVDRRRSFRGWWCIGTRDDEIRGRSAQGTDRCCWLRERFSGSSVGHPWPLPCVGEELLRGRLCCERQKTGSSVVCIGAVLAGGFCESGRQLAEDKGRLWAATWFIFTDDLPTHTHCGLFSGTTCPHILIVVYFQGRPAHTYSRWSIFKGDLPTHSYTGLFSRATYTYSYWSIFTGDLPTHTHAGLFSRATCPNILIMVYFHG